MRPTSPYRKTVATPSLRVRPFVAALAVLSALCLAGCKSAEVKAEREFGPGNLKKPAAIHVADFELSVEQIHHEEGRLSSRPGPVGRVGGRLSGESEDPAALARRLVELMSTSLLDDLSAAGLKAVRLQAGEAMPTEGWLLRGVFTEVEEGNRVRRSLIGFGEGHTDVQVIARVDDLSQGAPQPFYELDTDATSKSTPGAAPFLALNPYSAAARFVMAGKDLEKNVKQTASRIAERIAQRVETAK